MRGENMWEVVAVQLLGIQFTRQDVLLPTSSSRQENNGDLAGAQLKATIFLALLQRPLRNVSKVETTEANEEGRM